MREEIIELYENHNKIDKIENIIDEILKNINFDMDYNDYKKQRQYYNRDIYNSKYKKNNICIARICNNFGGRCSFKINPYDNVKYPIENNLCRKHISIVRKNKGTLNYGIYT